LGDLLYTVRVNDSSGNFVLGVEQSVGVSDNDDPSISNVDADPVTQLVDNYVNITATVTDNINVDLVKVRIDGPNGFTPINVSMTKFNGDVYYYNDNYSIPGIYNYSIWVNDTTGNSVESATYQFEMVQELKITNMLVKWNYISIPFNQEISRDDIFVVYEGSRYNWIEATTGGDPILLGFIYNWSRSIQNYGPGITQVLAPGYGYWMLAYKECELWAKNISAFTRGENITDLLVYWNAVGSPDCNSHNKNDLRVWYDGDIYTWTEATTGGDPIVLGFIYNWSRINQNYGFTDVIDPGYTYWIYAYYDCTLLFPSGYLHLIAEQQILEEKNELDINSLENADLIIEKNDEREITWDVTINLDETGGKNDYIIFGEAPDGSDGKDSYDTPNPPLGIPPFLDGFFTTNLSDPYDTLLKEIKHYPDIYKEWNFTAFWTGSSSTTITISWDTDEVNNSEYNSVILYDSDDNQVADMMVNSSYTKSVGPYGVISFRIECSSEENQPPEITCPGPQTVDEGELLEFIVNATDPDGTIPSLSAENLPSGADFTDNEDGNGTFSWTPTYTQSGNYDVTFNASDGEFWDTCTVDITVNNINQAPEITCPGSQSVDEGQLLEFVVSATDPDGTIPTLSAEDLPSGADFTDNGDGNGTFSWTPGYDQAGDYDVTFVASDGFLEDSCVVDITVDNVNRPPVINCPGPQTVTEGELLEFVVSATDPDGTIPSLSAEDLPSGASFSDNGDGTGTFSWTPGYDQAGDYDVTFVASDGFLEDSCIVQITVYEGENQPPVAVDDYAEVDEDTEDNMIDVLDNDYDPNGDDLIIESVTDPSHGTVENHGDYVTYTPDQDYYGDDTFDYTINDGQGETATATVDISVKNINDPPERPDPPSGPTKGKAGVTLTYSAVTTDKEDDKISYLFDWGDNTYSEWTQPYAPSGTNVSETHKWSKGIYNIRVKAKDEHGAETAWSEPLTIEIPRANERTTESGGSDYKSSNPFFNFLREGRTILDFIRLLFSTRSWIALYLLMS